MSGDHYVRSSRWFDDEQEPFDRVDDDPRAHIAASGTAGLPELSTDLDLTLGPEIRGGDADLPDQRIDSHGRSAPLRPPDEKPGLEDVDDRGDCDGDEPPRRREHEERQRERDEDEHRLEGTPRRP